MIVYQASKKGFRSDVKNNRIEKVILESFEKSLGHRTSKAEIRSWQNSMIYMSQILEDDSIPNDSLVSIEYKLPRTSKRVDFIISGENEKSEASIVIVELKQWETAEKTEQEGVVKAFVGGGIRELPHPSFQAWSYAAYLEDYSQAIADKGIILNPCSYLHNCDDDKDLKDEFYVEDLERAPLFTREDSKKLSDFIKRHIKSGDKDNLMYQIDHGEIRPTKKLADAFGEMLKGNKEFIMIDDQKVVYEKAKLLAIQSSKKSKNVLIVNGGPGTGKSVVAINLLVDLIQRRMNAQYVSKNAAPREVYSTKLTGVMTKSRYKSLFVGSGSFTDTPKNEFDALIVDEAHRLNEKSGLYSNLGENQIKEIIKSAAFSIFFLDEDQRIALSDIGSKEEIYHWANGEKANIHELTLNSQFRCNGSDGYLNWLDNVLQLRETANDSLEDLNFDFKVFDDPLEMHNVITELDKEGKSSRTVAGYCWDWLSSKNPKAYDIEVEGLKLRWNLKNHGPSWIINPSSISEAGCIHTCQGLEVDYIGVIIGPDFIVRDNEAMTNGMARPGRDKTLKGFRTLFRNDPVKAESLADTIIKNTYKTLMTRGMKGCYVYATDKETRDYLKAWIKK